MQHTQNPTSSDPQQRKSRWRTALRLLLVHFLPTACTAAILALNSAQPWWRNTAEANTNELLAVFQVVAKALEILIIFSMSQIVLFWLVRWLVVGDGIPFGLFASTYHVALAANPLSKGLWSSIGLALRNSNLLQLLLLAMVATFFGFTAGPAAAVSLIPRLDWWPNHGLFDQWSVDYGFRPLRYNMYIPKNLFPTQITEEELPNSNCMDPSTDRNGVCPYAGFQSLSLAFSNARESNITIDVDLSLGRRLIRADSLGIAQVVSSSIWTTNRILNDYLSLGVDTGYDGIGSIEAQVDNLPPPSPIVDIICGNSTPATEYERDLGFMTNYLVNANPLFTNDETNWKLDLRDTWNEDVLRHSSETLFEWRDDIFGNRNVMAGLILMPEQNDQPPNVTVCAVNAKWIRTDVWYVSTQGVVSSNFTWTYTLTPGGYIGWGSDVSRRIGSASINITKAWANVLNARDPNSNTTLLANHIRQAVGSGLSSMYTPDDSYDTSMVSANTIIPHLQMVALGTAVVDGLARIGAEYSIAPNTSEADTYRATNHTVLVCNDDGWCSQGSLLPSISKATVLNTTREEFLRRNPGWPAESIPVASDGRNDSQIMRSFPMPAGAKDEWTQISFTRKRYGYGWGINTKTAWLAAVVLGAYVVIVLVHCVVVMCLEVVDVGDAFGSLGEVLALTLTSTPPNPPRKIKMRSTEKSGTLRPIRDLMAKMRTWDEGTRVGWERDVALRERKGVHTGESRDVNLVVLGD